MSSISVSKMKIYKDCKLQFKYKYIDKWTPAEEKKEDVTAKGLVLHQCFENILKYENYKDGQPGLPYRQISEKEVLKIFKKAMEDNQLSVQAAKDYKLKDGLVRWLDFKHNYLDKRNNLCFSEKEYKRNLFEVLDPEDEEKAKKAAEERAKNKLEKEKCSTTAILDLLENNGDGTYTIYDYKTPSKANNSNHKLQLCVYAYMMAVELGLIEFGSEDYQTVADKFTLYIFYPLLEDERKDYKPFLKKLKFEAEDVKKAIESLKESELGIREYNFKASASILMPTTLKYCCDWCEYAGSKRQEINGEIFEGCPLTVWAQIECKHTYKRPEKHY